MKLVRKAGATSNILQIFIADSSSTVGAGLTGLTNASAGLTAYYHKDTDTTATAISLVTMTVGTFTSSGFKEIDATNMPGWYQFCPPDASFTSAKSVAFHLKGATNMAALPIEIDLWAVDPQTSTNMGISALPTANPGASNGVLIAGSNVATTITGLTLSGVAASGATPATAGLIVTGGAASTTGGGVSAAAATFTGGAGAASTNGAAAGATFTAGGTTTVSGSDGVTITGTKAGHGLNCQSGTGATGSGIVANSNATNGNGIWATGNGNLHGINTQGGATGNGVNFAGGATSGHGLVGAATNNGHGAQFNGVGVSKTGMQINGANASLGNSSGVALALIGGAASTTGGGVSSAGLSITGGAGAASTNGSAAGLTISAGGTTTVSGNDAATFSGTGNGSALTLTHAGTGKDLNAQTTNGLQVNVTQYNSQTAVTDGNNYPSVNIVDIAGSAVSTSTAQLGVNAVNIAGSAASLDSNNLLKVDVEDWKGTAVNSSVPPDTIFIRSGTAQAGGATSITLDAGASATNSLYNNCIVFIRSGTGAGQSNLITGYVGSTKVATVAFTWATNPDSTSVFSVLSIGPASSTISGTVTANVTQVNGHAVTDTASGVLDVNAKNIGGQAAQLDANNLLKVDLEDIHGNATCAANLQRSTAAICTATAGTGSTTTNIVVGSITPSMVVSGQFVGRIVIFDENTTTAGLRGQATNITANDAAGNITVTALTNAPANGDTFTIT